jgi:hypothetical protein
MGTYGGAGTYKYVHGTGWTKKLIKNKFIVTRNSKVLAAGNSLSGVTILCVLYLLWGIHSDNQSYQLISSRVELISN